MNHEHLFSGVPFVLCWTVFKSNFFIKVQCDSRWYFKLSLWKRIPDQTIERWVCRFWATASAGSLMHPGKSRNVFTIENINQVCAAFDHSLTYSACQHVKSLSIFQQHTLYSCWRFKLPSLKVYGNTTTAGFGWWEVKTFNGDHITETGSLVNKFGWYIDEGWSSLRIILQCG